MKIALAQLNPTVGDLAGNSRKIIDAITHARDQNADLVVFSELIIGGYPPRDLLQVEGFVEECAAMVKSIGEDHTKDIAIIIGSPLPSDNQSGTTNSLLVYSNNQYINHYHKRLLPTYDIFDEDRYFAAGNEHRIVEIAGVKLGLAICEDLWKGIDAGFADR